MFSQIKTTGFILVCVVLWLVMVITSIPAAWTAWVAHRVAPIQLSQVSGSFWSGRAASAVVSADNQTLPLGVLRWDLKPWALLILQVCAEVKTNMETQSFSGEWCFGIGGLSLSNGEFNAPAKLAERWLPVNINGQISAQIENADFDGSEISALAGNISWRAARLHNGREWMSLGAYAARLSEDGAGGVKADLFDLSGPLQVKLEVLAKEGIALKGKVVLRENTPPMIAQWLPLAGQKAADGSYIIDVSL